MNFNDLTQHIRELNIKEQQEHEQRREQALKRIRELRQQQPHTSTQSDSCVVTTAEDSHPFFSTLKGGVQ